MEPVDEPRISEAEEPAVRAEPAASAEALAASTTRRISERDRRFMRRLALVVATAAILRGLYLWQVASEGTFFEAVFLDADLYRAAGRRIATGGPAAIDGVYSLSPLYPFLLAAIDFVFGPKALPVYLFQQVLGLGTTTLVGLIGRRIGGDTAGLCAAIGIGFYAALAQLELKFMATCFAVFLSTLGLWLLVRARDRCDGIAPTLAGLVLGLACLARPNLLLFMPVGALWLLLERGGRFGLVARPGGFRAAAMLTLASVLAIAPATHHNYAVSGEWILISSQGGLTFYHANNSRSIGSYTATEGFSGHPARLEQEARAIAEEALGRRLSYAEVSGYFYAEGLRYLRENPQAAATLLFRKLGLWISNDELGTEYVPAMEREYTPVLWAFPVPFGLLLALAVVGAVLGRRRGGARAAPDPGVETLLWGVIAVNLATLLAFYVASRYRMAAMPALAALAGVGAARIGEGARSAVGEVAPRRALPALGAAAAILAVSLALPNRIVVNQSAAEHYNVGNDLFVRRDYEGAIRFYERALEQMDGKWEVHFNLGLAHARLSQWEPAAACFERVLQLQPTHQLAARALEEMRCQLDPKPGCPGL